MRTTSPFPGMDPYLEGFLWPDVHHHLASAIREILAPKIAPKYVALVDTYTMEDREAASEIGILYPDVAVLRRLEVEEAAVPYGEGRISPPTAVVGGLSGLTAPNARLGRRFGRRKLSGRKFPRRRSCRSLNFSACNPVACAFVFYRIWPPA